MGNKNMKTAKEMLNDLGFELNKYITIGSFGKHIEYWEDGQNHIEFKLDDKDYEIVFGRENWVHMEYLNKLVKAVKTRIKELGWKVMTDEEREKRFVELIRGGRDYYDFIRAYVKTIGRVPEYKPEKQIDRKK